MPPTYQTELYRRIHTQLASIQMIDCHEHLQRESEFPSREDLHFGRLFFHYASCDLVSAGMAPEQLARLQNDPALSPRQRFDLMAPWYRRSWNTAYMEALRIALQDLFGIADFAPDTVEPLTEALRAQVKPGFTRRVFDRAGVDFAMNHALGTNLVANPDYPPDSFICDLNNDFSHFPLAELSRASNLDIYSLDDYLRVIDWYFETYGKTSGAFKVGQAYERPLFYAEVPKSTAEAIFVRLAAPELLNQRPSRQEILTLDDFILHYLCRKCSEYDLRMKFHTGLQEGNGNLISNSRAALLANLFLKYPKTKFDLYHISYPYQEELITLVKNFANVTVDFCWMWIINPAAGRRALSDMLDTLPANKIHGFGGDFQFVEGVYGHAVIARREIARVLCEKVEEGRFSEQYALQVGQMLLRENALENFGLEEKRRKLG
jgi:hypothetical protein